LSPSATGRSFLETYLIAVVLVLFGAAHVYGASMIAAARTPVATVVVLQGD